MRLAAGVSSERERIVYSTRRSMSGIHSKDNGIGLKIRYWSVNGHFAIEAGHRGRYFRQKAAFYLDLEPIVSLVSVCLVSKRDLGLIADSLSDSGELYPSPRSFDDCYMYKCTFDSLTRAAPSNRSFRTIAADVRK